MNMWHTRFAHSLVPFFIYILACQGAKNIKPKVPALFTLGDSIVDPGNNDYIETDMKANHLPYGVNYIGSRPTGRFTNGKLGLDFLAESLGVKQTVPPYLDPSLTIEDLVSGVSFGSAGSGYDNLTAETVDVIPMWKQVELFTSYKARLKRIVGHNNSSFIISQAIYIVVAGTNDFVQNYFYLPTRQKQFSAQQYEDLLLRGCTNFVEDLYKLGARKIGVYGVPPVGCLPIQKTILKKNKLNGCINKCNQVALSYNKKLSQTIKDLQPRLPGIKLVYVDIYSIILDFVKNPIKYGFDISVRGCCGTGLSEIGLSCDNKSSMSCKDPSKYVFWDAVHLTEKAYHIASDIILKEYITELL